MNNMHKNAHKSIAIQSRIANYKHSKKSSKSSKVLETVGSVNSAASRYGIVLNTMNT